MRAEYFSRDKIRKAIAKLEYNPYSLDALHSEAVRFVKAKRYEECLEVLNEISERYEPTSELNLQKALCNCHLGYIQDAMYCCEQALELDKSNQEASTLLRKLEDRLDTLRKYTMSVYM